MGNCTSQSSDGVNRSSGDRVYRENIHKQTCQYLYNDQGSCSYCKDDEMVIDLRWIPSTSYAAGDRIIGDLAELGWMVVRTSRVSEEMNESIRQINKPGQGWDGKWFPTDATQRNRLMKYKPNSKKPSEWDEELPKKFLRNIRENILGKVLDDEKKSYTMMLPVIIF